MPTSASNDVPTSIDYTMANALHSNKTERSRRSVHLRASSFMFRSERTSITGAKRCTSCEKSADVSRRDQDHGRVVKKKVRAARR